jgi:hypothetical protein
MIFRLKAPALRILCDNRLALLCKNGSIIRLLFEDRDRNISQIVNVIIGILHLSLSFSSAPHAVCTYSVHQKCSCAYRFDEKNECDDDRASFDKSNATSQSEI